MIIATVLFMGTVMFGVVQAQSKEQLAELKAKKEVLKLNTKLANYKIDLEKEKLNHAKYLEEAKDVTGTADKLGTRFEGSADTASNAKEAKKVAKKMKAAQKANKNVTSSAKKIENLEKNIKKTESKIAELNHQIQFVEAK